MRRLSLSAKMSITVFFLVVGFISATEIFIFSYFEEEHKKSIPTHQSVLTSSMAREIDYKVEISQKILQQTADRITDKAFNNQEVAQTTIDGLKEALVLFDDGLFLFSPNGTLVAQSPYEPNMRGNNYSSSEYYKKTVSEGRPYISTPYRSTKKQQHPAIMLTVPLFDVKGKLTGILGGSFDLLKNNFLGEISNTSIGQTGYVYLLASDRTLIAHPDRNRILETLQPGRNQGIDKAFQGFEGSLENVNSSGVPGITTFKRLQTGGWIMAAHFPLAEAYAPIRAAKTNFWSILLGSLLFSIAISRMAMAYLTAPLLRFTHHVAHLGEKTGKERFFETAKTDEIGTLAHTFNAMIAELDQKQEELLKSKEMYQIVSDFAGDMAFWCDDQGLIRYISPYCQKLTGYTDREYIADPRLINCIIHPDDQEKWDRHLDQVGPELQPSPLEFRILTKAGEVRWVAHLCRCVFDSAGNPLGIRGSVSDIHEKKIMGEMVREQKEFAEALLQNAAVALFVLDTDHRVIAWNRACEELTGVKDTEVIGTHRHWMAFYDHDRPCLADIVLDNAPEQLDALYKSHSVSGLLPEGLQAEGWYPNLGGKNRYICFDAAPVRNHTGKLIAAIETLRDMTEHKEAEKQIISLRDYYLRLFQKFPAMIWRAGQDTKVDYFNDTWLEFTGRTFQQEVDSGGEEGVHPEDLNQCLSTYRSAFAARQDFTTEYRLRRYDGEYRWIIQNGRPFYAPDGFFVGYIGVCSDITERRQAEEQLRGLFKQIELGKKEWETTVDCIGDIVMLVDTEGKIRRCNKAITELVDKDYAEMVGTKWVKLLPMLPIGHDCLSARGGEVYHAGSDRWFNWFFYPLRQKETEQITGAVITMHDTTELKKITESLQNAYADVKETQSQMLQREKMASIGQLAAGVAHEINNPIGFVTSNIGSLKKYVEKLSQFIAAQDKALTANDPKRAHESIATLRKKLKLDYILDDIGQLIDESLDGTGRVKKIVEDLKTFSRVDEAESKVINLVDCLESTINIAWNELKYKATLQKNYGEIPPVKCYPQQLNQVFLNLLVNAAHAIENQGVVTVKTWHQNDSVCISISDTGCGIPEEIRTRIFEPFFSTKEVGKGTGLGLSISYDIIKKHKGEITVESEVGKGTTFTIELPLMPK